MANEQVTIDMGKLADCDEIEFERLISILSPVVLHHLIKRFHVDKADADDILQDTLIKLIKRLAAFGDWVSLQRWVFVVARNAATDRLRKEKRLNDYYEDYQDLAKNEILEIENNLNEAKGKLPVNDVEEYQKGLLTAALEKLPAKRRKLIEMRYYLGYTEREIADELKIPIGSVKAYLSNTRKDLRRMIQPFLIKNDL